MNLQRSLVAVAYSLVFLAFLPLVLSGEIGIWLPGAFLAALIGSLLRDPHGSPPRPGTARVWTTALIAAFFGLIAWSIQDSRWLVHAITFALLMTVSRLFQRRFSKDYLQLIALSFVLLLVSAVVYPGPAFALCFLGYTVLTMWGMALLHLSREIELQTCTGPEHLYPELPPTRRWFGLRKALPQAPQVVWPDPPVADGVLRWRTTRLLTKRWFGATAALALAVLAISALFFFLFPRLGMGFFFAQTRGAKNVVGFGTDAELGQFGQLKTSAEVVARVTFPDDPRRLELPLRLRGISFDQFTGTGWTRPAETAWELGQTAGHYAVPTTKAADPNSERTWKAEVYLEPLGQDTKVLFAPPRTENIELLDVRFDYLRGRKRRVSLTPAGDLSYKAPPDTALHYTAEVIEPQDAATDTRQLHDAPIDLPRRITQRWTQLPANLDPRIAALARKLVGNKTNRLEQVRAIEEGLRTGWTYSLAGDQDAQKPLEDFLFGNKRGHCEFFASSMTLMLRSLGHAARLVHGFSGGQINPYGNYRMVRQADAHAWVEVFFPEMGWRTFDPTPAAGQVAPPDEGTGAWLRQLSDQASLLWYQWVVEYDLERQIEFMKGIGSVFKSMRSPDAGHALTTQSDREADKTEKPRKLPWLIVVGLALLAIGAFVWLARRPTGGSPLHADLRAANRHVERALTRHGWARQPYETWQMVAQRVGTIDPQCAAPLQVFADTWDAARFATQAEAAGPSTVRAAARDVQHTLGCRPVTRKRKKQREVEEEQSPIA